MGMEYKCLTREEIKSLSDGAVVNFGNGHICEVVRFEDSKSIYREWDAEQKGFVAKIARYVILKDVSTGKETKSMATVLERATINSTDPTIERCAYCPKLRSSSDMKTATIRVNHSDQTGRYCADSPCAGYAQMAAEG